MIEFISSDFPKRINDEIKAAKREIKIAVAWITFSLFEDELLKAAKRNVKIEIIIDSNKDNNKQKESVDNLRKNGIKIYKIRMNSSMNHMHEKMAIIDDKMLLGSYNWTYNASKNFENLLIISDELELKQNMLSEFADILTFYANSNLLLKQEKDDNGKIVNLLLEDLDYSRCGTEEYDLYNVKIYENGNHKKNHIATNSVPFFQVDNSDEKYYYACLDILKTYNLGHCIDGIVVFDEEKQYHNGDHITFYKTIWKNRFTNCVENKYSEYDLDL